MLWILAVPVVAFLMYQLIDNYYEFNLPLFHAINSAGIGSEAFWQNITFLGDGLPAFVLLIFFCRHNARLLWLGLLAALITGLGVQVFKHLIEVSRPVGYLGLEHVQVIGRALRNNSFPSGHSATAFVLAGIIYHYICNSGLWPASVQLPKLRQILKGNWVVAEKFVALRITSHQIIGALLILLASLIAWSRVKVGAHWPADVLCGSVFGWYSAQWIVRIAQMKPRIGYARVSANLLYILAGACALKLLSFNGGYPLAENLAKVIAIMALGFLAVIFIERNFSVRLHLVPKFRRVQTSVNQ